MLSRYNNVLLEWNFEVVEVASISGAFSEPGYAPRRLLSAVKETLFKN